jgi:hypothetical protein
MSNDKTRAEQTTPTSRLLEQIRIATYQAELSGYWKRSSLSQEQRDQVGRAVEHLAGRLVALRAGKRLQHGWSITF